MPNWTKYWKTRRADWKAIHLDSWQHEHRSLITGKLKKLRWHSLFELGCGGGANLYRILHDFPDKEVGGVDINQDAINTLWQLREFLHKEHKTKKMFIEARDFVKEGAFISDKGVDISLSDMCCIYFNNRQIKRVLREIKRITRFDVIFVEFHHKNPLKRILLRLRSGYHAFDWQKLLEKNGFYDVEIEKIQEKDWPGGSPQKEFANIISAKL